MGRCQFLLWRPSGVLCLMSYHCHGDMSRTWVCKATISMNDRNCCCLLESEGRSSSQGVCWTQALYTLRGFSLACSHLSSTGRLARPVVSHAMLSPHLEIHLFLSFAPFVNTQCRITLSSCLCVGCCLARHKGPGGQQALTGLNQTKPAM